MQDASLVKVRRNVKAAARETVIVHRVKADGKLMIGRQMLNAHIGEFLEMMKLTDLWGNWFRSTRVLANLQG